ncbi:MULTISPECIES: RNA polymerase sigma-70 factor [Parabacteroides]|nr:MULTISPECIES: RNA polymerase sigma-70 factor [Parabacteroides]
MNDDFVNDDIALLNQVKEGNKRAFRLIFDKYYVPLCRFVNISLDDTFASEEIVQGLFVYLWDKREQLTIQLTLKSYLFQAVKNRTLNYYRDNRHIVFCDEMPYDVACENEEIELHELQNIIQEAILSLPEKCSEIFRLSREQNLSNAEIAELKNLSIRTVETHISNALSRIRQYLGNNYSYLW